MSHQVFVPRPPRSRRVAIVGVTSLVVVGVAVGWALTVGSVVRDGVSALQRNVTDAAALAAQANEAAAAERAALKEAMTPEPEAVVEPEAGMNEVEALRQAAAQAKDAFASPSTTPSSSPEPVEGQDDGSAQGIQDSEPAP
ncbi:hypothetical protein A2856_04300 [Candidatus Uhrbacteria bacterium RIFCSPHIGHO2_01_FULL_63_20]|uniref:Uncharacterized protein n=1 Tax=Candidatus Uhrbacteria bacterium RIFCSPHIGHO2_01_FULL_63_20 TaxID=1802385 RepID=A0A1F7TMM2_9BACT|nr:MAG: hypothetical protein A2856_04300 [Candidatus Uhrbacteria bacterium RIFCSPHIGHO2_01_FULL_63_20]